MFKRKIAGFALAFLLITALSTVIETDFIITAEAAQSTDISDCNIEGIKNKSYTGEKITQDIKVTYKGETLEKGKDYTLSYKNNTEIGTASIKISGTGVYSSSVIKTFSIRPKTVNITNISQNDKKITLEWKKVTDADGYKIYYSNKENGDYKVLKTIKSNSILSYTSTKSFETGSAYYFYIVSYKEADGKNYLSTRTSAHRISIPSTAPSVEGNWKLGYILVGDKRYTADEYINYITGELSGDYTDYYIQYYIGTYTSLFESLQIEFKKDATVTVGFSSDDSYNETSYYEQHDNVVSVNYDADTAELWFLNESGTELAISEEVFNGAILILVRV